MVEKKKKEVFVSLGIGSVKFKCPKCGKTNISRSATDRKNVVKYICSECGFEGPN